MEGVRNEISPMAVLLDGSQLRTPLECKAFKDRGLAPRPGTHIQPGGFRSFDVRASQGKRDKLTPLVLNADDATANVGQITWRTLGQDAGDRRERRGIDAVHAQ